MNITGNKIKRGEEMEEKIHDIRGIRAIRIRKSCPQILKKN